MSIPIPKFIANILKLPQAQIVVGSARFVQSQLPKVGVWGVPLVTLAGWMIFPALTDSFRTSLGLPSNSLKTFPIAKWKTEDLDKPPSRA